MRLRVTEGKAEMASTSPDLGAATAHAGRNDESAEKNEDVMSGHTEGWGTESPQVRQAKEEMQKMRAAQKARMYERLTSPQPGMPNGNPHNMQAEGFGKMLAAQGDQIGRIGTALAATRVADQIRDRFVENFLEDEKRNPAAKAAVAGLFSWLPLVPLKSTPRGSGVGGFMSDPKVLSFGATVLVGLFDAFKAQIREQSERVKRDGDKFKDEVKHEVKDEVKNEVQNGFKVMIEQLDEHIDKRFSELKKSRTTAPSA
jgi:hypothetical protein